MQNAPTHFFVLLLFSCMCLPVANAQADTVMQYPNFTTFGEHAFKVTRNEYLGKINPTPARPYETIIYVAIGENETRGYLAITAKNVWENELIDGDVQISLGNNSQVNCGKKRIFNTSGENGEQTIVALYFLSFGQLRQIAKHGIASLNFPLIDVRTNSLTPCMINQTPVQFTGK